MELEKILKQLHKIQPDPDYARGSKLRILNLSRRAPKLTFRTFVIGILRSGSAMAVTGLILVLALGGFSLYGLIGSFSGLDGSLRAEAQAISMQIQLADLQYRDGGYGRRSLIAGNDFSSPELEDLSATLPEEEQQPADDQNGEQDDSEAGEGSEPESGENGREPGVEPSGTSTEDNADAEAGVDTGADAGDNGRAASTTEDSVPVPEPVSVERALDILSR